MLFSVSTESNESDSSPRPSPRSRRRGLTQWNAELPSDHCADLASTLGVSVGGERASPGDVAVAGGVVNVAPFTENPLGSIVRFADCKIIAGDVLLSSGDPLSRNGKLVHESEAKITFLRAEIHRQKAVGIMLSSFPTDLLAQSRFVARRLDRGKLLEEEVENGFEEVPIFS